MVDCLKTAPVLAIDARQEETRKWEGSNQALTSKADGKKLNLG